MSSSQEQSLQAAAIDILDSAATQNGSISQSDIVEFLKNDAAFETLVRFIVLESSTPSTSVVASKDDNTRIQRSFYAMMILIQLLSNNSNSNAEIGNNNVIQENDDISGKVGLISKMLFQAYLYDTTTTTHIPHVNHLLRNLLTHCPGAVISAACAGGKFGIQNNLEHMIAFKTSSPSSTLALFSEIIIKGCCGATATPTTTTITNNTSIKKNIRKKFIHSLTEWGLVSHLVSLLTVSYDDYCINNSIAVHDDVNTTKTCNKLQQVLELDLHIDAICDSLLAIAEIIAFPPTTTDTTLYESCGEGAILKSFGEIEFVKTLVTIITSAETTIAQVATKEISLSLQRRATSAARALMMTFKLSFEKRQPDLTGAESNTISSPDDTNTNTCIIKSTMISMGITHRLFQNLILSLPSIVQAILHSIPRIDGPIDLITCEQQQYDGDDDDNNNEGVYHPGKSFVKRPFTTRRLLLVTLMADILYYESDPTTATEESLAMDTLLLLCSNDNTRSSSNFWSGLIHLLFSYPNNNLFQVQFYRLLLAILVRNHETSLKFVLQKCKLVTLFLKAATLSTSTICGCMLLQCLNAIRLRYQSLPPKSYLCTYLDSHDGWKAFLARMLEITKEQRVFGGGIAVAKNSIMTTTSDDCDSDVMLDSSEAVTAPSITTPDLVKLHQQDNDDDINISIDLGSAFATDLGLSMFTIYSGIAGEQQSITTATSSEEKNRVASKKSKKKNKMNKKK